MKLPRNSKVFRGQFDVAPFVGVFFLLLIFVLLDKQITFVPGVPVRLPEASTFSGFRGPAMSVIVKSGGQFYFDNRELKADEMLFEMRQVVSQFEQPLTLIVQTDTNVSQGVLMELYAMARQAGVRDAFHVVKPNR